MPLTIQDLRLGQEITLAGTIRTLDITNGLDEDHPDFGVLPDDEVLVTLHVKLGGPSPDRVLAATRDVVAQMTPAYGAWVTRNSPAVVRRLLDFVDEETAQALLAHFHISDKDR